MSWESPDHTETPADHTAWSAVALVDFIDRIREGAPISPELRRLNDERIEQLSAHTASRICLAMSDGELAAYCAPEPDSTIGIADLHTLQLQLDNELRRRNKPGLLGKLSSVLDSLSRRD